MINKIIQAVIVAFVLWLIYWLVTLLTATVGAPSFINVIALVICVLLFIGYLLRSFSIDI